ncbi:MAG: hypothetical protein LQ351_002484 [Letrouitia transgressa]|nr:MAG: hypothetical protein LQ351_002484 [Letrouitia transgressa]
MATFGIFVLISKTWRNSEKKNSFDPKEFSKFTLTSKMPVSSTSSIFTISASSSLQQRIAAAETFTKAIWSIQVKQPNLTIARFYTPLPPFLTNQLPKSSISSLELYLLIRNDPFGELSRYLHGLEPGTSVEIRGPYEEYHVDKDLDEVLFLAGGTGIAPALQLAYILFNGRKQAEMPKMHVLWANRRVEDCHGAELDNEHTSITNKIYKLFRSNTPPESNVPAEEQSIIFKELKALEAQYYENFSFSCYADERQKLITDKVLQSKIADSSQRRAPFDNRQTKSLIMISGPDGFISHFAGPKTPAGSQGLLGGVLARIDITGWMVWKL